MKKRIAVLGTAAAVLLSSSMAFAAAWNVPSNMRVVQKSNTDTSGRIYSTIKDALASITNASATNPVLIKVMPGEYDISTATIQMKPYVTIEGSGVDTTIIKTASINSSCSSTATGAIKMANNSAVKNLTIKTTSTADHVVGITASNIIKALVEGVKVIGTGATGADGICFWSDAGMVTEVELKNSILEVTTSFSQANAVKAQGYEGSITRFAASHSKFIAYNNNGTGDVINMEAPGVDITITDSVIEAAGTTPTVNYILNSNGGTMTIKNSKIVGSCKFNASENIPNSLKVLNSEIELGKTPICTEWDNPSVRLVNNVDENGDVIQNQ